MKRLRTLLVAVLATGALAAALFAATASADYGPGAVYQVEISANAQVKSTAIAVPDSRKMPKIVYAFRA